MSIRIVDTIGTSHPWSRERVELRLIAAFRLMPSCPVYGLGRQIRTVTGERTQLTIVLEWAALLDADPDARTYLWAWARCRATSSSYGALCAGSGWKRATAERGRRRGAEAIAAALRARAQPLIRLDNEKGAPGPFVGIAADQVI